MKSPERPCGATSFPTRDLVDGMSLPETSGRAGSGPNPPTRRAAIFDDTPPEIEARVIEGYRAMSPVERLARVVSLNRALEELATARLRSRYGPHLSPRELQLRLGALRLPREDMVRVFDWDPAERGY